MRAPYELSPLAKADLAALYAFGLERWGESQADRYFFALFDQFAEIAQDPMRHPITPDFREDCRRKVFGSHAIYFQTNENAVVILGIVGMQDFHRYK